MPFPPVLLCWCCTCLWRSCLRCLHSSSCILPTQAWIGFLGKSLVELFFCCFPYFGYFSDLLRFSLSLALYPATCQCEYNIYCCECSGIPQVDSGQVILVGICFWNNFLSDMCIMWCSRRCYWMCSMRAIMLILFVCFYVFFGKKIGVAMTGAILAVWHDLYLLLYGLNPMLFAGQSWLPNLLKLCGSLPWFFMTCINWELTFYLFKYFLYVFKHLL